MEDRTSFTEDELVELDAKIDGNTLLVGTTFYKITSSDPIKRVLYVVALHRKE